MLIDFESQTQNDKVRVKTLLKSHYRILIYTSNKIMFQNKN